MKTEAELTHAIELYGDTVKRLCLLYLKNDADTDDIFQTVFLKYYLSAPDFESDEHQKAWLLRVAINACKDLLKNVWKRQTMPLEQAAEIACAQENTDVLQAVLSLPAKYKDVVYLYYYEGYSAAEIGHILHKNQNTVYTRLARGREQLKDSLGGDLLD